MPLTPTLTIWQELAPYLDTTITVCIVLVVLWRAGLIRKKNGSGVAPTTHVSTEVFSVKMAEVGGSLQRIENGVGSIRQDVRELRDEQAALREKTGILEERINTHIQPYTGINRRRG